MIFPALAAQLAGYRTVLPGPAGFKDFIPFILMEGYNKLLKIKNHTKKKSHEILNPKPTGAFEPKNFHFKNVFIYINYNILF